MDSTLESSVLDQWTALLCHPDPVTLLPIDLLLQYHEQGVEN